METFIFFSSIFALHLFAVESPGPDFFVTVNESLRHSRKNGIGVTFGITLANMIHISYCLLGIGILIVNSIVAFTVLKIIGSLYLAYLGLKHYALKVHRLNCD